MSLKNVAVLSQAVASMLYTATTDLLQRLHPLSASQMREHEDRARRAVTDLGRWLAGLTPADVSGIVRDGRLPFDRWMPDAAGYDAMAVSALAQRIVREAAEKTGLPDADLHTLVTGAGAYLSGLSDHKLSYLSERAASYLLLGLREAV